jgi:Flp pilus assembly protein TadD
MKYSFEDIARYADDLMPPDEREAFKAALDTDLELQQQLALYRDVDTSLQQQFTRDEQREALQSTLQQMRKEYFGAQVAAPAKVIPFKRYLSAAIAVAAVLVVALFIWNPFAANLYDKYAGTQMVAQVERGSHIDTVLQNATTAFNNKEFTEAAVLLAEVVQTEPDNSFANFYFGVALLQTDKLAQARTVFTKLFNGESAFKYEAAFYLALSYLKEDNKAATKEWLKKIPQDAPNYNKTAELLKKL